MDTKGGGVQTKILGKKIGTLKAGGGKKIGPLARIYTPVKICLKKIISFVRKRTSLKEDLNDLSQMCPDHSLFGFHQKSPGAMASYMIYPEKARVHKVDIYILQRSKGKEGITPTRITSAPSTPYL